MHETHARKSSIRVMIVDDHGLFRTSVAQMLTEAGHEVSTASDGENALDVAERVKPQVVMMDVHMPGMSGIEATTRLLAMDPSIHVVMLSADDWHETVAQSLDAGAHGYLTKTIDMDDLLDAIRQVVAGQMVINSRLASDVLRRTSPSASLSDRERQILVSVARGLTARQTAQSLGISPRTVENHLARIRAKLGVTNRAQLTRYAIEQHLDK